MTRKPFIVLLVVALIALAGWFSYETFIKPKTTRIAHISYLCQEGKTIVADYYQGPSETTKPDEKPTPNGSVSLVLSDGRKLTLPQTVSASGIRYANADESMVFWSKGNGAFIVENNQESFTGCLEK